MHENDLLSDQLRETYNDLETARKQGDPDSAGVNDHEGPVNAVSLLQGRGIINEKEAGMLRERLASHERGKDIQKYSALVNTLKVRS
jgi:hypothetical protein